MNAKEFKEILLRILVITVLILILLSDIHPTSLQKIKRLQLLSKLSISPLNRGEGFSKYEFNRRRNRQKVLDRWVDIKRYNNNVNVLGEERLRYIETMALLNRQERSDGFSRRRRAETLRLSSVIQNRLWFMNNPEDCNREENRFFYCSGSVYGCGWGCHVHFVSDCLIMAFATSRTLVVDPEYYYVLAKYFKPISRCQHLWPGFSELMKNSSIQHYTNSTKEHRVVYHWPFQRKPRLGPVGFHNARPPYTLPYDLVDDLTMISPDPTAWYVGHFVSYILRPNRSFQPIVNNIISNHIKVAIHVRRTDKKSEAKYQDTDKYMDLVQEYFDIQDKTEGYKVDRKLFVATDDPTVIKEIQMKYPGIAIECNNSAIETATKVQERYSADGVFGIVTDVFKLASADFLVCTYSSNVCRLAYELRMGSRPFILNQNEVISLDDPWYTYFERNSFTKTFEAIEHQDNDGNNETLAFQIGDIIRSHALTQDKGLNLRTKENGYLKLSKLREIVFPSYSYPKFYAYRL